ncbi:MAG: sugar-binding protein [Cellvibrionaceae bacterium]
MTGTTMDTFRSGTLSRITAAFTCFIFTFVFYLSPTSKAVADEMGKDDERLARIEALLESTPEKKLAHRLQKLKQKLGKDLPAVVQTRLEEKGWLDSLADTVGLGDLPLTADETSELAQLKTDIETAYSEALAQFEVEGEKLTSKANLPESVKAKIQERHAAALEKIKTQYEELTAKLAQLTTTDDADEQKQLLDQLSEKLNKVSFKRSHAHDDPNSLPWRINTQKAREPKTEKADLQAAIGINPLANYSQVASTNLMPGMLAAGAFSLATQPTDADLGESVDVQITDEIRALSQSLNNNPVDIYTWVHNNIRFIPSYGSIQGAQYTLEAKRGNAIDTASLLIALLRAANIPAQYAYGTVEMPINKVMNWVGGVDTPEAALNLLGQGGIPNTGLRETGVIKAVRLEHTWVKAFVDFEPSRGLINREGDNWIPMDASFKQYDFQPGMNLQGEVPFDAQALVDSIEQNATINETEGWVQNVPQADIETQLQDFQTQIEDYINTQNPDATVGEVLGLQQITILPPQQPLSAGLPYNHLVTQDSFAEVPDSLRHKFKYQLATFTSGYPGSAFISLNQPTVTLAGKKLALSFKPTTEDDQAIIESYLPESDPETGEIAPEQLPSTLPGYSINLTAELTVNGEVQTQATENTQPMGTELYETLGLYTPGIGWHLSNNYPIAGEYRAIGLDLQGISPTQAQTLKDNIELTNAKLESEDETQLQTLTKHDVVGDLIYGTIMSYFALNGIQDEIQAQSANVVNYRLPSYGIFSTSLTPQYWFGVPRNTSFSGLSMDVDLVKLHRSAKDNDHQKTINYTKAVGSRYSAMEHLVPEQTFSTAEAPAQGISAVKALAIAAAEGQKVYTITQANLNEALNAINLSSETEAEIRNAVNAGKTATAHESQITFNNWVGSGYLLIDEQTGAGAYKIAGGSNGSWLGPEQAISLSFSFMGLHIGLSEKQASGAMKGMLKVIGKILGGMGTFLNVIFTAVNVMQKCQGVSAIGIAMLLAINLAMILFLAYITFVTGGVMAFLLNSIINSFVSMMNSLIMNVLANDAGCN